MESNHLAIQQELNLLYSKNKSSNQLHNDIIKTNVTDFKNEWDYVMLKEVTERFISGGTPDTSNPIYWNGNIPWITSASIIGLFVDSSKYYISNDGLKNSTTNIVPKNNILISSRVGIGKSAINRLDIAISQDLTGVVVNKDKILPEFLIWYLLSKGFINTIKSLSHGTSIKGIKRDELEKIKIPIPSLFEQRKIAAFLSSINTLIETTDKVIVHTNLLYFQIMNRLLIKGINHSKYKKTIIGLIPEDWDVKKIDEIKSNKPHAISMGPFGSNITADNFISEGIPVIRGINLTSLYVNNNGFVFIKENKADDLQPSNAYPKDIVITHRGTIGQVSIIHENSKYQRYVVSQSQMKLSCDENMVNPYYVNYYLNSKIGQKLLLNNKSQTGVPSIGQPTTTLKNILIPIPPIMEQQEIVKILNTIYEKRNTEYYYKLKLEKIKESLIQILLTGKVGVGLCP